MLCATLLVLGVSASVFAAPYVPFDNNYHEPLYRPPPPPPYHPHYQPSRAFGSDTFDARQFWMDLTREMMSIDQMMNDLHARFSPALPSSEYTGNTYKISVPLVGFEDKEIRVKATGSVMMIQAVHQGENEKTYVDVRTLPNDVNENGTWTYDGKLLVIVFPLKTSTDADENAAGQDSTETVTTEAETETVSVSDTVTKDREEMEPNQNVDEEDADVGLNNKQSKSESNEEIETNIIATAAPVHATTYSVNSNDNDVEFVPIKY